MGHVEQFGIHLRTLFVPTQSVYVPLCPSTAVSVIPVLSCLYLCSSLAILHTPHIADPARNYREKEMSPMSKEGHSRGSSSFAVLLNIYQMLPTGSVCR